MKRIAVIGAGAAGMAAALSAAEAGVDVIILEAAAKPGRKILASGNGRCNLMNLSTPRYEGDPAFARRVLDILPAPKLWQWFEHIGLCMHTEEDGRVYPACDQASAVTEVLLNALNAHGAVIETDCRVNDIRKLRSGFDIVTNKGVLSADRVIAAPGGMAGGRLGHDGSAYGLFTRLGHTLVSPRPALTPLETEKKRVQGLSGLRIPARLTLCEGKTPVEAAAGEVLFTDYGVSGICAMQLSRTAGGLLAQGKKPVLYLDLSPMPGLAERVYARVPAASPFENESKMRELIARRAELFGEDRVLSGLTPKLLNAYLRSVPVSALPRALCAMALPITGVRGFENAQVTAGGLDTAEFIPDTCASGLVPGLYAAGELLNVDGDCGGFNLLFAFASGILAGKNAAK